MDQLYELLAPPTTLGTRWPLADNPQTATYLTRLSTLSLADLTTTEPASLLQSSQSHLRNLQALAQRSHKAIIAGADHTSHLGEVLPHLQLQAKGLRDGLPQLESAATAFAQKYDRSTENMVLDRRKQALLLSRNVDRTSDLLDLPTLLSSAVAAAQSASTGSSSVTSASYASALDLHVHIKRLAALYPRSPLVSDISRQAEAEMQNLVTILITSLQSPNLRLAGAMRTIGWLRRVAPDLAEDSSRTKADAAPARALHVIADTAGSDGALGSLFLVCRLRALISTLEALEPLRELAEQETARRRTDASGGPVKAATTSTTLGSQSERYLKRYVEIFREQSFGIVSMYKSIFPTGLPTAEESTNGDASAGGDPLLPLPSPVASLSLRLVDMLAATVREFMPNMAERQARESLLTQVLYCAGSLSRLGADFSMVVALLVEDMADETDGHLGTGDSDGEPEWVQVMVKHRVQASRLKVLARGVGTGRKGSADLLSPVSPA